MIAAGYSLAERVNSVKDIAVRVVHNELANITTKELPDGWAERAILEGFAWTDVMTLESTSVVLIPYLRALLIPTAKTVDLTNAGCILRRLARRKYLDAIEILRKITPPKI